ncbi:MAG: sigma-70 family RNA polymerase sigma factor [Verrucomicrobia bacterium]|nr:sigma-70 family RNA polymerase sigma factor [Verrucomicrobiota bacterium]
MDASDAALLSRYAAEHDEAAFAELVRRYLNLVYFTALRQVGGDAHRAEDVTQNVLTRLARKAAALTHHEALAGWLHTSTRFAASEEMRTERRRARREQEAFAMHATSGDSGNDTEWDRLRPVIDEALAELSEADREAVLLRYFAGQPLAAVGAKQQVSENAARMRIDRALDKLHALLAKRGVTSTSGALAAALANQALASAPAGLAASVTGTVLTSVAAGAVGVGLFGLMSTAKFAAGIAVVAGVVGVGTAVHEHRATARVGAEAAALRDEAATLRAQQARQAGRLRAVEQAAQAGEARAATLEKELAAARATPSAGTGASSSAGASGPVPISVDPMLSDPEYFRLNGEKTRAQLRQKFGALYTALKLTPEQISRFEANRTEHSQAQLEVISSAAARGVSTSDPSVSQLLVDGLMSWDKELMALLGPDGYKLYAEHNRLQTAATFASELAGSVFRTDSPMTAAQGEQLTRLISQETRSIEESSSGSRRVVRRVTDWERVVSQAPAFLVGTQLDTLRAQIEVRRLQDRMIEVSRTAREVAEKKRGK